MESAQSSLVMMGATGIPKTWETLFSHALRIVNEIAEHGRADPFWTFGGGTVLMLRYGHRFSKDIDIFVPDPQSLGYVTPRLSEVVESMTTEYVETNNCVKLYFPEGEIDFVAAPNLTSPGFEVTNVLGQPVRVETSVEIIAKKMWHRGDRITGRDIFDFALIAAKEPKALMSERGLMIRHADAIVKQLEERSAPLRIQFEAVDTLQFHPSFEDACQTLKDHLKLMTTL